MHNPSVVMTGKNRTCDATPRGGGTDPENTSDKPIEFCSWYASSSTGTSSSRLHSPLDSPTTLFSSFVFALVWPSAFSPSTWISLLSHPATSCRFSLVTPFPFSLVLKFATTMMYKQKRLADCQPFVSYVFCLSSASVFRSARTGTGIALLRLRSIFRSAHISS